MGISHPPAAPHAVLPRSPTPPVSNSPSTSDKEDEEGEPPVGDIDFDSDIFSMSKKQVRVTHDLAYSAKSCFLHFCQYQKLFLSSTGK